MRRPVVRKRQLHLLVGLAIAVLTVVFASARAADGTRAALDARLLHAGAGANAGLVDVESEQLAVARAVRSRRASRRTWPRTTTRR